MGEGGIVGEGGTVGGIVGEGWTVEEGRGTVGEGRGTVGRGGGNVTLCGHVLSGVAVYTPL